LPSSIEPLAAFPRFDGTIQSRQAFQPPGTDYTCVATFVELYYPSMVRFEWDKSKAKTNARKHGVRFEDAMLVFADSLALVEQDRLEGGELRWQTLGLAGGIVLLLVAHTVRDQQEDEIIRMISARRATRRERKRYDENRKEEPLG
jgi:uncharacterized DUF497 family protein